MDRRNSLDKPKDFKGFYLYDTEDHISKAGLDASGLRLIPENTVLIVVRSGILIHTLPVAVTKAKTAINQDIKALIPKIEINSEYLGLYLEIFGKKLLPIITKHSTTVQSINTDQFEELLIPIPDSRTQQRLVSEMETARAKRQSMLAEAEKLFTNIDDIVLPKLGIKPFSEKHRFVYAIKLGETDSRLDAYANQPRFHNLRKILKEKYSAVELSSIALDIFSGTTPLVGGDAYADEVNGIPFVRSGEITSDGLISENHDVFLKPDVHETAMRRSQLKQDDLLIAIVGATIGAVGVYKSDKPANINQAIAAVRLPTDKVLPEFVSWYLKSSIGQGMLDFLKRPVARANINLEEIGQILIPIPTLTIQEEIIKNIEARRAQARQLREEAERLWQGAKEKFEKALLG